MTCCEFGAVQRTKSKELDFWSAAPEGAALPSKW
jgi:hypothetical protein